MAKHSNTINFILTPIVALFFFAFYYRAHLNYTEHVVTNLYMSGFTALVFVVFIAPFLLLTNSTSMYYAEVTAFLLFQVFYRTVTYYGLM